MNDTRTLGQPLGTGPRPPAEKTFRHTDIPAARRFAAPFGAHAGMGPARLADFVLAVSEATSCAVSHGPCTARLRLWASGQRAFCEVRGGGVALQPGWDTRHGDAEALRRWLLRQVCDHVRVESGPHGVTVCFSMAIS
jgi:hypothetical protein